MNDYELYDLREVVDILKDTEFKPLVDVLMDEECFTMKGRLNKSAVVRKMGWRSYDFDRHMEELREFLSTLV